MRKRKSLCVHSSSRVRYLQTGVPQQVGLQATDESSGVKCAKHSLPTAPQEHLQSPFHFGILGLLGHPMWLYALRACSTCPKCKPQDTLGLCLGLDRGLGLRLPTANTRAHWWAPSLALRGRRPTTRNMAMVLESWVQLVMVLPRKTMLKLLRRLQEPCGLLHV
mmetsp:Transcript_506/g.717  ORF Transcript_506/g.717 Transcript_506/m.717 type:complete len:164 (+) Transcript_506:1059-1550(+)